MATKQALIVDDSSTAQYRLKKMLRVFDLDIAIVDSGEEALRYLAHTTPHVVFMDHLMPGMDGFKALQIIKSHPETATVPVIMYTSQSGDVYTGQARALGALDVVSKDTINAADLGHVLAKLHIEHKEKQAQSNDKQESISDTLSAAEETEIKSTSESENETVVDFNRGSSDKNSQAEARNVELRISHLEHSLEENRRFITARVVRELQSLRHKMKREMKEVVENSQVHEDVGTKSTTPDTQLDELLSIDESQGTSSSWSFFQILLFIVVLAASALLYFQTQSALYKVGQTQVQLSGQVNGLIEANIALADASLFNNLNSDVIRSASSTAYLNEAFLSDLTWAFNQSGSYKFNADSFDADARLKLYEFFSRANRNGFVGVAIVTVHLGNFCLSLNEFGQPMMAGANTTSDECLLVSEAYEMDAITKQYSEDIRSALSEFYEGPAGQSDLAVEVGATKFLYPSRAARVSSTLWNEAASKNTFIEVELIPDEF